VLYVTITGSYNLPTGVAASGTVRFTLVPAVRVNGTGPIVESGVTVALDTTGAFSLDLLANTEPTVLPTGSYYVVTETIGGGAKRQYRVAVPHDGGSPLDLATLPRVEG
jgi:hypothetical protein